MCCYLLRLQMEETVNVRSPQYENVMQGVGHVLNSVFYFYILQCVPVCCTLMMYTFVGIWYLLGIGGLSGMCLGI